MPRYIAFATAFILAALGVAGGWFLRDFVGPTPKPRLAYETRRELPTAWQEPGWEYDRRKYRNVVRFHFGDQANTQFVGLCDSQPVFFLNGGDYSSSPGTFDLTIDGQSWTLPVSQGEHGRGLFVDYDDPRFVDRLARARQRISFKVGNWTRTFSPGPEIPWFVQQCRAIRQRDPKSMGVGSEF